MRWILIIVTLLLGLGWLAWDWDAPETETANVSVRWVRTVDGWEHASSLTPRAPPYAPPLHPLVVALGQVQLAALAFLLFPTKSRPRL